MSKIPKIWRRQIATTRKETIKLTPQEHRNAVSAKARLLKRKAKEAPMMPAQHWDHKIREEEDAFWARYTPEARDSDRAYQYMCQQRLKIALKRARVWAKQSKGNKSEE